MQYKSTGVLKCDDVNVPFFFYLVNKAQPYRAPPKNTAVGSRGDTGKVEELSAQVLIIFCLSTCV